MKTKKFEELLTDCLKNEAVKKEYDALEEEFEVAKEIISLRIKAGLTQRDLAEQAHTSQAAISRLESGTYRNVSLAFLRRIGNVLGVQPHVSFRSQAITSRSKQIAAKKTVENRKLKLATTV